MRELEMLKEARTMRRRIWNRFLTLLGKEPAPARPRVIVFGTTEMPFLLSQEEFKLGRFEETAYLGRPSPEGRREIIEYALAQTPSVDIDIDEIVGWSGYLNAGELVFAITEDATRHARADGRDVITQGDLKAVYREKVLGGEIQRARHGTKLGTPCWFTSSLMTTASLSSALWRIQAGAAGGRISGSAPMRRTYQNTCLLTAS